MSDVATTLAAAEARLEAAGVDAPRHDAEVLLAFTAAVPRSRIRLLDVLDTQQAAAFEAALARRELREPLQHITGTVGFRHLDLEVGPGVFVPRPETEVMTGAAIDEVRRLQDLGVAEPLVVDLCSGSGAVGLAIATEAAPCRIVAVELSPDAAGYASRNASRLATDVELRVGDIADAVDDLTGQVSVVAANPPYIPLTAFESVAVEARDFDPPLALWSGNDGLDQVRVVADVAGRLLVDNGLVLCEHADVQGESAPAVFASTGLWRAVADRPDLSGRARFTTARRVPRHPGSAGTMSS